VKIYNTIKQSLDELLFDKSSEIKMYVCGITPYDETHLGHGRCYVVFDIIRRYLEYKGYKIKFVQNFTDVDDKIINKSKELKISCKELTEKYINSYFEIEKSLNIKPADLYPRVTQHIDDIVKVVEKLLQKGFAYTTSTGVYFEISKFKNYGKLSKRNLDELIFGARVDNDETKKFPLDFALWKLKKPDEPEEVSWDSPWGKGRPGWHIECTVMSTKYLGETLDIHGGGQDLIFPHHENEVAQSEALTGKEFVRYWVHNGFVTVNKEKMSKSLKNIFAMKDLILNYNPMIVRLFLLSQHYRNPLNFSLEEIDQFKSVYEKFVNLKEDLSFYCSKVKDEGGINEKVKFEIQKLFNEFESAMEDDFNTSVALSVVHKMVNYINLLLKKENKKTLNFVEYKFISILNILGISLPEKFEVPKEINDLILTRELARKNKDFITADNIRNQILEKGFLVEDTPFGPRVKKK
jgi:cysteinyl-tRNA synthetase